MKRYRDTSLMTRQRGKRLVNRGAPPPRNGRRILPNPRALRFGQMPKYVECRSYILKVGTTQRYLQLYESIGYPVQRRYLGEPLGFFFTEIGALNKIIHMWGYDSLDDRAERRARLFADPDWMEFLEQSWPIVETQTTELLRPHVFGDANARLSVSAKNS